MHIHRLFAVAIMSMLVFMVGLGGGFQIGEHGTRAMGMGGAYVAVATDASAIYFNPAGLAFQKGLNLSIGSLAIFPSSKFTSQAPLPITETKMISNTFIIPNAYAVFATDRGLAFGIGMFTPFGLGTEWPENWFGRSLGVKSDLQTIFVNPTVSYKISENLSVGGGVSYVLANVLLDRIVGFPADPPLPAAPDVKIKLDGSGTGLNFNAGILYRPMPDLSIGLSYRHSTELNLDGDMEFGNLPVLYKALFPKGKGTTTVTLPYNLQFGGAYQLNNNFTIAADIQYVGWKNYDTLLVRLEKNYPVFGKELKDDKDWDNSILLRIGGEYRMGEMALRAGFIYDRTPQPDKDVEPMLPDADKVSFTLGLGYKISQSISVDVAYQFVKYVDRTVKYPINGFPGTYVTSGNLFAVNLNFSF